MEHDDQKIELADIEKDAEPLPECVLALGHTFSVRNRTKAKKLLFHGAGDDGLEKLMIDTFKGPL